MRLIRIPLFLIVCAGLTGFFSNPLDEVEEVAKAKAECLSDCGEYFEKLRNARLKAVKAGYSKDQIQASITLGRESAELPCVEYDFSAVDALVDPYSSLKENKRPLCQ